jgi:hypothetical protein
MTTAYNSSRDALLASTRQANLPVSNAGAPLDRAEALKGLALLPGTAHLTSKEAAIYIGTSADVLRVWRSTGRGPRFKGRGYFVRYVKSDLDDFMGGHDHRFDQSTGPGSADLPNHCSPSK